MDAERKKIASLIKPLQFPSGCPRGRRVESRPNSLLKYTIAHYRGDVGDPVYRWASEGGKWSEHFHTYEAAKEAANGDYVDRVLTAFYIPAGDGPTIHFDGTGEDALRQIAKAEGK